MAKRKSSITLTRQQNIFIGFLVRDFGFTQYEALTEFYFIQQVGEVGYITATRLGMRPIGGRAVRQSIIQSYQNAENHATFDQV